VGGGGGVSASAPPRQGEAVTIDITSVASGGEGVGRSGDLVVFVPGAVPGDRVRARIAQVRPRYARADLLTVERPSPDRRPAPCPVWERCGGCPLMPLAPAAQRRHKRARLIEVLARIGGIAGAEVEDVLTAPPRPDGQPDLAYRAKAAMPVAAGPRGPIVGFYGRGSHRLVEASACPVTHPLARRVVAAVRDSLAPAGLVPYDEASGRGEVRHIVVRVGLGTGESMAVVVTRSPRPRALHRLAEEVTARLPELTCLAHSVQPEATNRILGRGPARVLAGRDGIRERVGPLTLHLSPTSFFQVNPAAAEILYARAVAELGPAGAGTVVDAHAGVGAIGLWAVAAGAERAIGFETVAAAVADARRNAAMNGLAAEFSLGPAEILYGRRWPAGEGPDAVVLDPPRAGCPSALLEGLRSAPPARLVYVSCAPETLARDLARLTAGGRFRLERVVPVDLFPQTAHLEAVAVLRRDR
jgi:23S rRNA (uracil1939-C5)-methyltransferase